MCIAPPPPPGPLQVAVCVGYIFAEILFRGGWDVTMRCAAGGYRKMAAGLTAAPAGACPKRRSTCSAPAFALLIAVAIAVFGQCECSFCFLIQMPPFSLSLASAWLVEPDGALKDRWGGVCFFFGLTKPRLGRMLEGLGRWGKNKCQKVASVGTVESDRPKEWMCLAWHLKQIYCFCYIQ